MSHLVLFLLGVAVGLGLRLHRLVHRAEPLRIGGSQSVAKPPYKHVKLPVLSCNIAHAVESQILGGTWRNN